MRILIAFLLMASVAFAEPFLVSDPYGPCGESGQSACPVTATIYENGVVVADNVALQPDYSIKYDLSTMPTDEINYTATYKDALGRVSNVSNPYLLLKKGHAPLNLRASP